MNVRLKAARVGHGLSPWTVQRMRNCLLALGQYHFLHNFCNGASLYWCSFDPFSLHIQFVALKINALILFCIYCTAYKLNFTELNSASVHCVSRIVMGKQLKQAFGNKKRLLTSNMNLDFKKKIVKCTIWSVVLYGAETWTMTQTDKERLEAFEMWTWRRMLKVSWVDKVSNAEVLQSAESTRKQEHLRHCTTL